MGPLLLLVLILRKVVLARENLIEVLLPNLHLLIELFDDEGVSDQILMSLPFQLVVLQALSQEEDALQGQDLLACVS